MAAERRPRARSRGRRAGPASRRAAAPARGAPRRRARRPRHACGTRTGRAPPAGSPSARAARANTVPAAGGRLTRAGSDGGRERSSAAPSRPMGPLMRRALPLLLLALLAMPAAAAAQDDSGEEPAPTETPTPTDDGGGQDSWSFAALDYDGPAARISRGSRLSFTVRTDAPAGSVVVRVAGTEETDEEGLLSGDDGDWVDETAAPAGDGVQVWTPPASSILRQRPGHYFWQAYLTGAAADDAEEPIGPVRQLTVTQPIAMRGRGSLFPRFGRGGNTSFYLSSADFPGGVTGKRFQTLARIAAGRWGLRALRWTSAGAGRQDGFNVAGFSTKVPDGVLGVETDFTLHGRVIERDLALNANEDWAAGPDYPALDQIDLESVLLHELAHMAGNRRHRKHCANSPMVAALGEGEWWRGARDHWFADCAHGARAARVHAQLRSLAPRVIAVD